MHMQPLPRAVPASYDFLTIEEVQQVCRAKGIEISLWTLRRLVKQGKLARFGGGRFKPYGRTSNWRILVPRASLESWLRSITWDGTLDHYHRRRKRKTTVF